jgi:hypothetical protein
VKDSRLTAQYALAWVQLTFKPAGINVIMTCPQALNIYPVARLAVICTQFWYNATDLDKLRASFLIVSIITFWITMCTDFRTHKDFAFQMSQLMQFTCSSVSWQTDILHICQSCDIMPRQSLNIRLWTSFISLFWHLGVLNGFSVFGKLWNPAILCTCNLSIQKLWKQHSVFMVCAN